MDWKTLAAIEQAFLKHAHAAGHHPDDYMGMQVDSDGGVLLSFFYNPMCGDWEVKRHLIPQAEAEALVANVSQRSAQHGDSVATVIDVTADAFVTTHRDDPALVLAAGL